MKVREGRGESCIRKCRTHDISVHENLNSSRRDHILIGSGKAGMKVHRGGGA